VAGSLERLGAFWDVELRPTPWRVRAFLRVEAALVLASLIVITFKPTNPSWIVFYLLLVSSPAVGYSVDDAIARVVASVIGGAAAILSIIAAYDSPWLFTPLQALGLGIALFIARVTPVGQVALTGGATFAVISGSDVTALPANLITLAFYRVLQAVIGGGLGAFAQLTFWPDDPRDWLRRSLREQLAAVEQRLDGQPVALDPGRITRHFELLGNAQVRHSGLARRRTEIAELILDVGCAVDSALRLDRGAAAPGLRDAIAKARRRLDTPALFTPPPAQPIPPSHFWQDVRRETMQPARRDVLKLMLSVFLAAIALHLVGFPAGTALFAALALSQAASSGTSMWKSLMVIGGVLLGLAVVMLVVAPAMASVDDPGSYLLLAAAGFAPTIWLYIAGARVRSAGLFGTVVVTSSLFGDFRPGVDLEASARTAFTVGGGALIVGVIGRVVWPVDPRRGMWRRAALLLREAAALEREADPCAVLAPNLRARWHLHRHLLALVQLRAERVPMPGRPCFEEEEAALRVAAETVRRVVLRIDEARRERAGEPAPRSQAERSAVARRLEEQAAELDRRAQGRLPR
jgi:uncharacterized membrane protein YccC